MVLPSASTLPAMSRWHRLPWVWEISPSIPSAFIDVRKVDFDILRPKRHETPAHYIQAALTGAGIVVGAPIVQPVRIRARAITSARLASAAVTKLGLEYR
jgi:hypothetical protein